MLYDYLKKCGKPIVWTLHDCWSFTRHCSHYNFSGCKKWKELCYKCPLKKEYPASVLADRSRLNYLEKQKLFTGVKNLHIAVPSEWLKNQVEQSFLKEYPVSVINNGIDLNIFKPCKSDFTDKNNISDKIILLGVANVWTEKKGIRDFITLSEKLVKHAHLEKNVLLVGSYATFNLWEPGRYQSYVESSLEEENEMSQLLQQLGL